jgi:hypothetical protein
MVPKSSGTFFQSGSSYLGWKGPVWPQSLRKKAQSLWPAICYLPCSQVKGGPLLVAFYFGCRARKEESAHPRRFRYEVE